MPQGWTVNAAADTISFYEPPANGAAIVVSEYGADGRGGTNVWSVGAWSPRFGYPREAEFYGGRLWFAGTAGDPQTIWASNIGDYNNFGRSSPIVDSDAVSFTINARQVNAIMDLVPLDSMLVLTTGGEWKVTGGQDDVVTPSTIGVKPQSNYGTGSLQARVLGESAIFQQAQGRRVRDLAYQFEKDGFRGNDISIWADHLIKGYSFTGLEYSTSPWPILWMPRSDGVLIGCTYMPEQEVTGWHRHQTDGEILDVCCLPGEMETEVYVLVRRIINGQPVQYIEQLAPTEYADISDWKYADSLLTYDGRNTTATTLALSSAGGWGEGAALTATASTALFNPGTDAGNILQFEVAGERLRVRIIDVISPTVASVESIGNVGHAFRAVPLTAWTFQKLVIAGMEHLEGKGVVALVDGNVQRDLSVVSGKVRLQRPGGVVQIGLPYQAHIETLEVNSSGGEPLRPMKKLTFEVALLVRNTRGVYVGTTLDTLDPIAQREFEDYDEPTKAYNGVLKVKMSSQWNRNGGKFHLVSDDPVPMEILALMPNVDVSP
ncbi:hypothetical protein A9K58_00455 [Stenotrophomonas maltophilia]|uniref:Uncharacterized protein n=1 Tax=Stenotrophomonas maltophilia TaxID=40324 RepID=A0A1A6Y3M3_STEMA|nr:hypothetical protein [Stenotrophomonas maltophilia]OBU70457.1 hypothetical protein A9K58_00455 [Stenotrophomonas maltophilia]